MQKFNPEKELYKIQHGNRNKVILFVISLLIVGIIGYSFALYQVRYSKRIIYTKVAPFSNKDIELAVYLDGEPSSESDFPEKNSGYVYEKTVCDNNSTAFFDNVGWNLYLKANKKDKCNVYFITNDSEPNPPELYKGLIPVTFDDTGKVYVANLSNNDWYDYDDKRWANAVLVNSTKFTELTYNGLVKEEKYGTEISMSDILQMYVWIPRYKYQLFNVDNVGVEEQEIKIQFESGIDNTGNIECKYTNNKDGSITEKCTQKGTEIDAQNGDWYTHPAFTFKGTFEESGTELKGIWVGKFEPSHTTKSKGNNWDSDASAVLNCNSEDCTESDNIRIKPNELSLRYNNISNFFYVSRSIEKKGNIYNLDSNQIDTHMMKNQEWGAMAYLTQSKYGRCDGKGTCTAVTKNTQPYKTGYDNTSSLWYTKNGTNASTTGNIYGIYDTNGGTWESVMGNLVDNSGEFNSLTSGFKTAPAEKYYDIYAYEDDGNYLTYERGHLGDASRETIKIIDLNNGEWYSAFAFFPANNCPWTRRGGYYGDTDTRAGTFALHTWPGAGHGTESFRIVLTAQDGDE